MTAPQCARDGGFHPSYWNKLEAGEYLSPDAKHLATIAAVLGCPLEDLYTLAGYTSTSELPTLGPYLRAKYDLAKEDVAQLEGYFKFLRHQYGIPNNQPVFPPKPTPETEPASEPSDADEPESDRRAA